MPEVEIVDGGDDMMDEAVIRGLERAFDARDADDRAQLPPPQEGPEGVKVTGRLRRVRAGVARHYGPGTHPGTGTEQEVHAGDGGGGQNGADDGTISVGITSAREGKPSEQVFDEMRDFESRMRELEGVSDVSIKPGLGGWEGGSEPTWIVQYKGNGEAMSLIAETAKNTQQDAVLVMEPPGEGGGNPITDWDFGDRITPSRRQAIENLLVDHGVGGWSWYRTEGGGRRLRTTYVPEWSERNVGEHLRAIEEISGTFSQLGLDYSRSDNTVATRIMEKEGENSYDQFIEDQP